MTPDEITTESVMDNRSGILAYYRDAQALKPYYARVWTHEVLHYVMTKEFELVEPIETTTAPTHFMLFISGASDLQKIKAKHMHLLVAIETERILFYNLYGSRKLASDIEDFMYTHSLMEKSFSASPHVFDDNVLSPPIIERDYRPKKTVVAFNKTSTVCYMEDVIDNTIMEFCLENPTWKNTYGSGLTHKALLPYYRASVLGYTNISLVSGNREGYVPAAAIEALNNGNLAIFLSANGSIEEEFSEKYGIPSVTAPKLKMLIKNYAVANTMYETHYQNQFKLMSQITRPSSWIRAIGK